MSEEESNNSIQTLPIDRKEAKSIIVIHKDPIFSQITIDDLDKLPCNIKRTTLQPIRTNQEIQFSKIKKKKPKKNTKSILKNSPSFNSTESFGQTTACESISNIEMIVRRDQFGNEISHAKQHKITFNVEQQINYIESYKEYNLPKQQEQKLDNEGKSCCPKCATF